MQRLERNKKRSDYSAAVRLVMFPKAIASLVEYLLAYASIL